jgi:hypothetical protein
MGFFAGWGRLRAGFRLGIAISGSGTQVFMPSERSACVCNYEEERKGTEDECRSQRREPGSQKSKAKRQKPKAKTGMTKEIERSSVKRKGQD